MEGLFLIIVIVMIAFSMIFGKKQTSASSAQSAVKQRNPNDVPSSLKAKWNAEDNRNNSSARPTSRPAPKKGLSIGRNLAGQSGGGSIKRDQAEEKRRQSRRHDEQTKAHQKAMARLGDGTPRDKNANRLHGWGQRGHFGKGWVTPVFVSILSAAAVAVWLNGA